MMDQAAWIGCTSLRLEKWVAIVIIILLKFCQYSSTFKLVKPVSLMLHQGILINEVYSSAQSKVLRLRDANCDKGK